MLANIIGERLIALNFGESHGRCVGVVVDGMPAGLAVKEQDIQYKLDLRKPGQSIITTQRKEEDRVEILSGIFNGYTTGAPICMIIWNKDQDSRPYEVIRYTPRPGHADYPAYVKYHGYNDYRGGGRFSGRLTATFVMAGTLAEKLLRDTLGIEVLAYTKEIGGIKARDLSIEEIRELRYSNDVRCPDQDAAKEMKNAILNARAEGDSLGGIIECIALNVPVGLGEPIFGALEADLARAILSIPAVKGIEFGSGFNGSRLRGSENNDSYEIRDGRIVTKSNNSGGILGGLSNGMPIRFNIAFKPASSIAKKQKTVDLVKNEEAEIVVPGRHDPCVVPRAPPVIEGIVAFILADHAIRAGMIPMVLGDEQRVRRA